MFKQEHVVELARYVAEVPPAGSDEKRRLKYPQVCHDLLTTTAFILSDEGSIDEGVLALLLAFLDRDPAAASDDVLAATTRSTHVLASLAMTRLGPILDYLKKVPGCVDKIVAHVAMPDVVDFVAKLVTCDDCKHVSDVCPSGRSCCCCSCL